jgi:hypothetical protein
MSHAVDNSEVEERSQIKSVSRDVTFEEDTSNLEFVLNVLDELAPEVNEDVLDRGYFSEPLQLGFAMRILRLTLKAGPFL